MAVRGGDLSDFMKGQIYALRRHAQWSYGRISGVTGVAYQSVAKFCTRDMHPTARKGFCGRKAVTTATFNRWVVWLSNNDSFRSARSITQEMSLVQPVCTDTVTKILHTAGKRASKPAKKPKISEQAQHNCLHWCTQYLHWNLQWRNVIFSDE